MRIGICIYECKYAIRPICFHFVYNSQKKLNYQSTAEENVNLNQA